MLEKVIEAHLVKRVKEAGGIAYKFTSPQRRSVPDRMIVMNGDDYAVQQLRYLANESISDDMLRDIARRVVAGYICFVETKATGAKPTPGQLREHARLEALGLRVDVIDNKEEIDLRWER